MWERTLLVVLVGAGMLVLGSGADAKRFDETHVQCTSALTVRLDPGRDVGDPPTLVVEAACFTSAVDGTPLRMLTKNIADSLTANQVQQFTRVLQRVEGTIARRAGVPTPIATPTDIVVRTPQPEPT